METTHRLSAVFAIIALFAMSGCETLIWVGARRSQDWQSIQTVGGLALGKPERDARGHTLLPIRCNVSGTETITVRPTGINSASVCEPPLVRVRNGTVFLTVRTTIVSGHNSNANCPKADLGILAPGPYAVVYRSPDGTQNPLGTIEVPPH